MSINSLFFFIDDFILKLQLYQLKLKLLVTIINQWYFIKKILFESIFLKGLKFIILIYMKRAILIVFLVYELSSLGQGSIVPVAIPIKSIKLDSLIFKEILFYRASQPKPPSVPKFDIGDLRKTSYVLTDLNTSRPDSEFDHTRDPNLIFKGYNGECIFQFKRSTSHNNPLTDYNLTDAELEFLAKTTVNAWIQSPNHNYIIRAGFIKSMSITSTVTLNNNSIRLIVSYHHIDQYEHY